jgi:cell division protein FtsI (penicillin-binding protein 3)
VFGRTTNAPLAAAPQATDSFRRILALKIGLLAFFFFIGMRLVQIQVIEAPRYKDLARKQYEAKVDLPATRGNIYDRNGKILVSNAMFVSFGADPLIVGANAAAVADRFAAAFGKSRAAYMEKLTAPNKRFVWLERRVDPKFAGRINADEFEGVIQLNEPKRLYHYDHLAGQLIGFTDIDNKGLSGMELEADHLLRGSNGYVIMQRDGLGRKRPSVDYPRIDPVNGDDVVLTIDLDFQSVAEEELHKGVVRNKAASGLVIMLEPSTGEILAMAHYPGIDPNNAFGDGHVRARIGVQDRHHVGRAGARSGQARAEVLRGERPLLRCPPGREKEGDFRYA